jgi:hypothetical protein
MLGCFGDMQRLPDVQQLVRSLAVENDSLREEMRTLQRACAALSKENDKLEVITILICFSFSSSQIWHLGQ